MGPFKKPAEVHATIERNLIVSAKDAIWIPFTHGDYIVKENVVWAFENGVGLVDRDQTSNGFVLRVQNNTIAANHFLYAGEQTSQSVGKAEFICNVVANRLELESTPMNKTALRFEKRWTRSKNWYLQEPAPHDSLPLTDDEQVASSLLVTDDWKDPSFGRLRTDSPAATGDRGGTSPTYAGAMPPDSSSSDDWLAKLRKHPAARP